jgi:hypothetical protein
MQKVPFVISVVRSGGFAGLRREWSIEVTAVEEAERWHPIIDACPWDEDEGPGNPDGFVYALRAADNSAVIPENRLEGAWRQLVDEVRRCSPDRTPEA